MKYTIEELSISKNQAFSKATLVGNSTKCDTAVIIHVFYIDVWDELANYLSHLDIDYDLFITVSETMDNKDIQKLMDFRQDVHIYRVENRGRDVLPFLQVLNLIDIKKYKYICKLHTKKTGSSDLGNVWRKLLYFDLIGSDKTVEKILKMLKNDPEAGMVAGKNSILSSKEYDFGNSEKVKELAELCSIGYEENYYFAAGTMFWVKSDVLNPIKKAFAKGKLEFETEMGQTERTLAHAIERFFGLLCYGAGKKIIESPTKYSKLNDETLDQVASLVLTQKYIDYGEYIRMQKRIKEQDSWIKELNKTVKKQDLWIKELEDLAQSLRIKNRLKRLYPKGIISASQSLVKNPQLVKKAFFHIRQGNIKFLISRAKEKLKKNNINNESIDHIDPRKYFEKFDPQKYSLGDIVIDIIIPVYNGMEFLPALFDSIKKNTMSPYRLIVVNDCSPDERVKPYLLERLKEHPNAIFIDHNENQGFLKSVNEARERVSNHFIILNTDTEVPEYWLERMMYPIIHMEKVATTTPFTNSGEIASFPNFIADNPIFEGIKVNELDKVFREIKPDNLYESLPTGVGFCMGVNYELSEKIGFFTEDKFGKGYGEENDWCQRAIKNGYRNLLVPNLFVYHKHGGSFSAEEKQKLLNENLVKLTKIHPNYSNDVHAYIEKNPHRILRNLLVMAASSRTGEGISLIVDHDIGGGANVYRSELAESYIEEERKTLQLLYDYYRGEYIIKFDYKDYHFTFAVEDFDGIVELFKHLELKEIFLNNLVSFPNIDETINWLIEVSSKEDIKLTIPIHDFYPICPSYTLLNDKGNFCNVPSLEECQKCIKNNDLEWRTYFNGSADIPRWRGEWNALLDKASRILCFSDSSKKLIKKAYPQIDKQKIEVIPHTVDELPSADKPENSECKTITIGIIGAINYSKGSGIIKNLSKEIEKSNIPIKIVLIGEISEPIRSKVFKSTGRYKRDDLPQIVKKMEIDLFLIPSIWPETFSYTTQEVIMMDMPLMVFDIGAPAERVREYDRGLILEDITSESIIKGAEELCRRG